MSITSIRLRSDLEQLLETTARELDRSKNWIINEALREYFLSQQIEAQRWRETLEALESVKTNDVIEAERVHRWLESWGTEGELAPSDK